MLISSGRPRQQHLFIFMLQEKAPLEFPLPMPAAKVETVHGGMKARWGRTMPWRVGLSSASLSGI
jgi:hypothetical protein